MGTAPTDLSVESGLAAAPPDRVMSSRGILLAVVLVLLWVLASCGIVVNAGRNFAQSFLIVIGFGAILTVFLLQFPRLFLVTVLGVYAGSWALMFSQATPEDHDRLRTGLVFSLPVMAVLAAVAVSLWRAPLRRSELVILYTCVLVTIPWCFCIKAVIESSTANLFDVQRNSEPTVYAWSRALPWWGPTVTDDRTTTAAVLGFTRGNGGHVPWALWWRPLVYWTGMCLAFEAMLMGLVLMFRRVWIEHERLPFVWAYPAMQIIGQDRNLSRRGWVLFAVGLAICLPAVLFTGPTGEPLGGWNMPPWVASGQGLTVGFDLTALNLIPGVPLKLYWCPLVLTLLLLFPMDLLLTAAVTYLLFFIVLPPLSTALGLELGPRRIGEFNSLGLRVGGGAGLLVWAVWFNRRVILDYFRSLWGARPRSRESADDLPRPVLALMFILGTAAFFVLGCYATSAAQMAFVIPLVLIFAFWQIRFRAEGMPTASEHNLPSHMLNGIERSVLMDHPTLATKADPTGQPYPVTPNSWGAHWYLWSFAAQLKMFGPHTMLLEAFKVGYEFRVPARKIAMAVLLTLLGVAVIMPVIYVQAMYLYGFENSYSGDLATWSSFTQWSERAAKYGQVTTSSVFIAAEGTFLQMYRPTIFMAIGVALMGVLFYLRREYPRFAIHPVGVVLGAEILHGPGGLHMSPDYVWFSFLAAGIFKLLVFRWLGIRTFRERIQPAVVLILIGMIYGIGLYLFRQLTFGMGVLR